MEYTNLITRGVINIFTVAGGAVVLGSVGSLAGIVTGATLNVSYNAISSPKKTAREIGELVSMTRKKFMERGEAPREDSYYGGRSRRG